MKIRVSAALIGVAASAASLAAAPVAAGMESSRLDPVERNVISLVNAQRARYGLARVRSDARLNRSADHHSRAMLRHDFFAHESPDGGPMDMRVNSFRPSQRVAENLAYIERGADEVLAAQRVVGLWMWSSQHREIVLSEEFRRIGVARRGGALGTVAAMVFTANFASRR